MSGMSDSYTQYLGPGIKVYEGDVNSTESADDIPRQFRDVISSPCLTYKVEKLSMETGDTRDISPMLMGASGDNEKVLCIVDVIGKIEVNTAGDDFDDSTPVAGISQSYGTQYFPGRLVLTTYNLDSIEIEALADSTVTVFTAVLVSSTDARL